MGARCNRRMLPVQLPETNYYGRDVVGHLSSDASPTPLDAGHARIWELAKKYLNVRNNDVHSLYAYGIGRALLTQHADADPDIVLPAILLHDTGWSRVPEGEVLSAIAPGAGRPDLVVLHEKEGAAIAEQILAELEWDPDRTQSIVAIVDGHDSRPQAHDLNDALMKDADKLWRLSPHGVETVMNWFGLSRSQAQVLIDSRVHQHLLTETGRAYGRLLSSILAVDSCPQRVELG